MSLKRKRNYTIGCRCVICNRPFRASRSDAKYCSSICRKKASRSRAGQAKPVNVSKSSQMTLADLETILTREQINARIDRLFA